MKTLKNGLADTDKRQLLSLKQVLMSTVVEFKECSFKRK